MIRVSAAEFRKRFGWFHRAARHEPVTVTSHGRESVVLVSATDFAEYQKLKQEKATALRVWEMSGEEVAALEAAEPTEPVFRNDSLLQDETL